MQRIAMTVMLKDKPGIIEEYDRIHADPYPVVLEKGHQAGIRRLFIYRLRRQLFMFIETDDGFDIETSMAEALTDPEFMEWETLAWELQAAVPGEPEDTRWVPMTELRHILCIARRDTQRSGYNVM